MVAPRPITCEEMQPGFQSRGCIGPLRKVLRSGGTRRLCRQHLSEHAAHRSTHDCQRCGTTKQVNHAQQAKAGSCAGRTNRAREEKNLLVASSDESDAHHATNARSCGSAHSCRQMHCFDQDRSDLWSMYHEGSHSRFASVLHHIHAASHNIV